MLEHALEFDPILQTLRCNIDENESFQGKITTNITELKEKLQQLSLCLKYAQAEEKRITARLSERKQQVGSESFGCAPPRLLVFIGRTSNS
jgi:hypothetical protein